MDEQIIRGLEAKSAQYEENIAALTAEVVRLTKFAMWVEQYASDIDGLVFERLRNKACEALGGGES